MAPSTVLGLQVSGTAYLLCSPRDGAVCIAQISFDPKNGISHFLWIQSCGVNQDCTVKIFSRRNSDTQWYFYCFVTYIQYLFTRYFTLWNTCDYRRSGSLWDSRAAGRHKGLFLWGCTMFSCSTLLLLFQNRQHCRLSICIFVNRFEANPNNNLMMRQAGLSVPNHCANQHTPGKFSHYDYY